MPCEMMVLSRATTGRPAASAADTSALTVTPAAAAVLRACDSVGVSKGRPHLSQQLCKGGERQGRAKGEEPHLGGGRSCLQRLIAPLLSSNIVRSQVTR